MAFVCIIMPKTKLHFCNIKAHHPNITIIKCARPQRPNTSTRNLHRPIMYFKLQQGVSKFIETVTSTTTSTLTSSGHNGESNPQLVDTTDVKLRGWLGRVDRG